MGKEKLSVSQKRAMDQWFTSFKKLPEEVRLAQIATFIKLYRKRLRMTQRQLAQRAGLTQPYIAKLERGHSEVTLASLKKIFNALYCDVVLLPIPNQDFDQIIEARAKMRATKKLQYIKGTMALEEQLPKRSMIRTLIYDETKKLIESNSSEIWE